MRLTTIIEGAGWRGLPALALTLTPSVAFAQQQAAVRQFSISPQLRLTHDDNVLRLPDSVPTPTGQHRGDYRASPQLAINITRPIGRQQLFLNGVVGYDFYRYNKDLERERIALSGGGTMQTGGGCATTAQLSYSRRQSELDDLIVSGFGGRIKNRETFVSPSVSINCGSAGGLSSGLEYSHDDVENSDISRAYGDYHADTYNARIGLNRPALGDIGLYANYRRGIYDNRLLPGGVTESVKSYAAGIRADRQFGRIKGHVAGGITRVQPNTPGVRGFSGGTYDVGLSYLTSRTTARVALARSIQQSNLLGVNYSVTDSLSAGVTYRLNPRIVLNSGACGTRRRLSQSPLAPVTGGNFNDRTRIFDVGASFEAARHIAFDFGATWRQRRGGAAIYDYDSRLLALTLRIH